MKKKLLLLVSMMLVLSLFLAACGGKKEESSSNNNNNNNNQGEEKKEDPNKPQDGGTLNYALTSSFNGLLDINFYENATDGEIIGFFQEGFIKYDENLKPVPHLAEWKTEDNKVYNFKIKEGVKWHNGDDLVVDDWIFALETIAKVKDHPRWTNVSTIVGAADFKDGKADSIAGLKKISDHEIEITFEEAAINNLENLWTYPMNRKHFEGIDPNKMSESTQVRTEPVGTGPFKVQNVLPGESVELVRNENYWGGKPHIEKIIIKVYDASLVVKSLEAGDIDMVSIAPAQLPEIEKLTNVKVERYPGLSYYYVGFKFGELKDGKVVMNRDKYNDKNLRKAMMYALNREEWINAFWGGLGTPINSVIPSSHWIAASSSELPNDYKYDPEMAKKILADAGWKDVNGDGFVEDPNGNEFVINFGHYATTNPTFETRARQLTQYWEEVGLKTKLTMTDSNLYYDQIQKDHKSVEVFFGGWSTGADPDPWGLWGDDTSFNYPRWTNDKALQIMKDAVNLDVVGQDTDKRKALYVEFQSIINEELPMLPILELEDASALNNRLQNVTFDVSGTNSPHEWWLKQNEE
ncbi:oligopeptide ABC transporter substrate-binding protein [Bacillus kwashiorkori]|uniref:oligopeptide ABC transporter substrate-binding protein n=1 Tax=Bacillus kwashiorkori TaxID=1522318 RepID=UPI000A466F8D|nr:oligopeptide ABC transporter substrate-binding protein [Bacillus kwashiorkori]